MVQSELFLKRERRGRPFFLLLSSSERKVRRVHEIIFLALFFRSVFFFCKEREL